MKRYTFPLFIGLLAVAIAAFPYIFFGLLNLIIQAGRAILGY